MRAFSPADHPELEKMAIAWTDSRGPGFIGQTGVVSMQSLVPAVAVDPLPGIVTLSQARRLVEKIRHGRGVAAQLDPFGSLRSALTLLAAAIDLTGAQGTNGLDLMRAGINGDTLRELVTQSKMSADCLQLANCEELFRGLYRARDLDVEIGITGTGNAKFKVDPLPPVSAAESLIGFMMFYDSEVSPELPVVVDDALSRVGEPTLVVSAQRPFDDAGDCLAVTVLESSRLERERDWRTGGCDYATVTDYIPKTARAVYTEGGRAQMVEIPKTYQLS